MQEVFGCNEHYYGTRRKKQQRLKVCSILLLEFVFELWTLIWTSQMGEENWR